MVRRRDRVGLARAARARARPTRGRSRRTTHGSLCVIQCWTRSPSRADDGLGVLDERLGGRARGPAARVLERLRRVPVEERRERLDPVREQLVDEPVVEVEARLRSRGRGPSGSTRGHAIEKRNASSPSSRISAMSSRIAVVEVARDRAGVAVPHLARRRAEAVPDALAAAVLVRRRPRSGTRPSPRPRRSRSGSGWCRWPWAFLSVRWSTGR